MPRADAFEGVVDLAALDDTVGHVTFPATGRRHAVLNPTIGVIRQLQSLMGADGNAGDMGQLVHCLGQIIPTASQEEIESLRQSQIAFVIALAIKPSEAMARYGGLTNPNASRGSASSSAPTTGSVTSSGASPVPPGETPTA